jgi:hypothetical protein
VQYFIPGSTPGQRKILDDLRREFGEMPPGISTAGGAVLLPKRTDAESVLSQTVRTILENGQVAKALNPEFLDAAINGRFSHEVSGDAAAKGYAESLIKDGLASAREAWDSAVLRDSVGKPQIVLAESLIQEYARAGDKMGALDVAADLIRYNTEAGQRLQAMRMIRQTGPVGSVMYYKKLVKQLNATLESRYPNGWKVREGMQTDAHPIGGVASGVDLNYELLGALLTARSETEREAAARALEADLTRQLPPTNWVERANSWRHLAMLGNTRTLLRNVTGNAAFVLPVYLRNKVAALAERALPQSSRSKAFSVKREYRAIAALDYARNKTRSIAWFLTRWARGIAGSRSGTTYPRWAGTCSHAGSIYRVGWTR